jgi:ribonuclease HII
MTPNTNLEFSLLEKGFQRIIGIDEAGRGSWAGPVYVGGYIFKINSAQVSGVKDSKLLYAPKRQHLFESVSKSPESAILKTGEIATINSKGIGRTITDLIAEIVEEFEDDTTYFLIDGVFKRDFGVNSRKIIKGDRKHYSISCASIIAKVNRDSYMTALSTKFPAYAFEKHFGYGTKEHLELIKKYGVSSEHRINYKPIRLIRDQINLL